MTHACHANGCFDVAHNELPFCQYHFGMLPSAHRSKLWKGRRRDKLCGACYVRDCGCEDEHVCGGAEIKHRRSEDWDSLYHLGLSILLEVEFGGCGAPPPYQDETEFCWACGIPDALKNEATAKKVVEKFELKA